MANANQIQSTKVITGKVRLSYAHLFTPQAIGDSDAKKYSVALIIPKTDKETLTKMKKAIDAAAEIGKSSKFNGKIPANLKSPVRDGDTEREDDDAYAGCYFVNANSSTRPGIIGLDRQPITDPEEVYSGCYAVVSMNFYAYNVNGNRGIACGLNNIMKVSDGDPLGGRVDAATDFDGVDFKDQDANVDDIF